MNNYMKNKFKLWTVACFLLATTANAQELKKNKFLFHNKSMEYTLYHFDQKSDSFIVVILDQEKASQIQETTLKNCIRNKKRKSNLYYVVVPSEFTTEKEEYAMTALITISSKSLLREKKLEIITDSDYLNNYEVKRQNSIENKKMIFKLTKESLELKKVNTAESNEKLKKISRKLEEYKDDKSKIAYANLNAIQKMTVLKPEEDICSYLN